MAAKTKKTAPKRISEHTWEMLHAAFVAPRKVAADEDLVTLRHLARTFDVPLVEATRRAEIGRWELEWKANEARRWRADYGRGAATEAEFLERYVPETFGLKVTGSPEGERYAKALARRLWTHTQADISRWETYAEEDAARAALDAYEERNRRCSNCARAA